MRIKEIVDLFKYSIKEFMKETFGLLKEIKKPRTWIYLSFFCLVYGIWKQNLFLIAVVIPILLMIYIVRQRIDGGYRRAVYIKDLINKKDSYIIKDYYKRYVKHCTAIKISPLDYNEFKEKEIKEYYEKNT